ncbi:MAG: hypothetical protein WDO71_02585 [Bacteroidota bacterium]
MTGFTLSGNYNNLSIHAKRKNHFGCLFLITGFLSRAQDQAVIQNYISKYKDIAIAKCSGQVYLHLSNWHRVFMRQQPVPACW